MLKKQFVLMLLMLSASIAAIYLTPTHKIAQDRKDFNLEKIIPKQFGDWHVDDDGVRVILNQQQEYMINKIYRQSISRTYVNSDGKRVMLVIAYGENQSDNTQLHYPEVCYPAQGFQIKKRELSWVAVKGKNIPVTKLVAEQNGRIEPITYWATIGDKVVRPGWQTKVEQLNYGFKGEIPDGLLFRVSSIGDSSEYSVHQEFINELITNIDSKDLPALIGIHPKMS